MTQAEGVSTLHETVQQNRFQYVDELKKMGATIEFFKPQVENPESVYNFNLQDLTGDELHAIKITGPSALHSGEFTVKDLRHGATLMIAGLLATGQTILHDPQSHIDRGYEKLDEQLTTMGANITRME